MSEVWLPLEHWGRARRSRGATLFFFSLLLLLLPVIVTAGDKETACCDYSTDKKPVWTAMLDLPAGCQPFGTNNNETLVFTDSQKIVVGVHLQCAQPPHTLDLVLQIDAQSGKVLQRMEWKDASITSNQAGDIWIVPVHDGQFLVSIGSFMKLFSPEFKELRSRTIINSGDSLGPDEFRVVRAAPGGKVGFFKRWSKSSPSSQDHWFSTDTLEDELVEPVPLEESWRPVITESRVYFDSYHPPPAKPNEPAYARERGEAKAQPLCDACNGLPMAVIADGTVFLQTVPKASFMLVSPQNKIIHRASYGSGNDYVTQVKTASDVPRFAFTFGHIQRRLTSFKSIDAVIVFDTRKMSDVFRLKISQQSQKYLGGERWQTPLIALSPDGERLAVLNQAVLKLFQVR